MHYYIGNVFCVFVNNVHVLIFQVQNNIITIHHAITTIIFHVYHLFSGCTVHVRRPFNENKQCQ